MTSSPSTRSRRVGRHGGGDRLLGPVGGVRFAGNCPIGQHFFMAISGTSMSSPHVAGLFALLKQALLDWSAAADQSALMTTGAMQLDRLAGERSAAIALVRRAVELGVDHVDTAQFYRHGFVSQVLAEALSLADGVIIVSKVGADPDPGGRFPMRPAQRPQ